MNLLSKNMRAFFGGSVAIATVLAGCAIAAGDSSGSKNTPEQAAKDETPEVEIDVPVPGVVDALAIQLGIARRSLDAMAAGSTRLGEIGRHLADEAVKPLTSRFSAG